MLATSKPSPAKKGAKNQRNVRVHIGSDVIPCTESQAFQHRKMEPITCEAGTMTPWVSGYFQLHWILPWRYDQSLPRLHEMLPILGLPGHPRKASTERQEVHMWSMAKLPDLDIVPSNGSIYVSITSYSQGGISSSTIEKTTNIYPKTLKKNSDLKKKHEKKLLFACK